MNSEEARNIIARLNASLKASGLDWVVQEVSVVVERGIEERKEVALESFDASDMPIKKRGRKTEVTVTRPFTDLEELRLLLAALRAVFDANEMQEKALLGLKPEVAQSPQIFFRPDVPEGFEDKGYSVGDEGRGHSFDLSIQDVEARKENIARLRAIVLQLEEKTHAD